MKIADRRRKCYCWYCKHELRWQADYDSEDFGLEGDGLVTLLSCPNCGADVLYYEKGVELEMTAPGTA